MNEQLNDPTAFLLKRVQELETDNYSLKRMNELLSEQLRIAVFEPNRFRREREVW